MREVRLSNACSPKLKKEKKYCQQLAAVLSSFSQADTHFIYSI